MHRPMLPDGRPFPRAVDRRNSPKRLYRRFQNKIVHAQLQLLPRHFQRRIRRSPQLSQRSRIHLPLDVKMRGGRLTFHQTTGDGRSHLGNRTNPILCNRLPAKNTRRNRPTPRRCPFHIPTNDSPSWTCSRHPSYIHPFRCRYFFCEGRDLDPPQIHHCCHRGGCHRMGRGTARRSLGNWCGRGHGSGCTE